MNGARAIADVLVRTKRKELDIDRKFSGGKGGAKTFLDEERKTQELSFSIENHQATAVSIAIGDYRASQFSHSKADFNTALGVTAQIADGDIAVDAVGNKVTVTSSTSNSVTAAVNYMGKTPTRFTGLKMISTKLADGAPAPENYNGSLKFVFLSPWKKPTEDFLPLRNTQSNASVSPQFGEVNFIKEGKNALVSDENFMVVKVEAGTRLDLTFLVGMQYSKAQEFYRAVKMADETLASLKKGVSTCEA